MTPGVRLDRVLIAIAATLVGAGIALALVPGLDAFLPEPVHQLEQEYDPNTVSQLAAGVLALYVLWRLHRTRGASSASTAPADGQGGRSGRGARGSGRDGRGSGRDRRGSGRGAHGTGRDGSGSGRDAGDGDAARSADTTTSAPGSGAEQSNLHGSASRSSGIVGSEFTKRYDRQVSSLRSTSGAPEPESPRGLREAIEAVERASGFDAATASDRVERGAWTDDPIAAAFVGGPDAGAVPFWRRVYAVLYPARAFERRFERTLAAAERAAAELQDGRRAGPDSSQDATEGGVQDATQNATGDATAERAADEPESAVAPTEADDAPGTAGTSRGREA